MLWLRNAYYELGRFPNKKRAKTEQIVDSILGVNLILSYPTCIIKHGSLHYLVCGINIDFLSSGSLHFAPLIRPFEFLNLCADYNMVCRRPSGGPRQGADTAIDECKDLNLDSIALSQSFQP